METYAETIPEDVKEIVEEIATLKPAVQPVGRVVSLVGVPAHAVPAYAFILNEVPETTIFCEVVADAR